MTSTGAAQVDNKPPVAIGLPRHSVAAQKSLPLPRYATDVTHDVQSGPTRSHATIRCVSGGDSGCACRRGAAWYIGVFVSEVPAEHSVPWNISAAAGAGQDLWRPTAHVPEHQRHSRCRARPVASNSSCARTSAPQPVPGKTCGVQQLMCPNISATAGAGQDLWRPTAHVPEHQRHSRCRARPVASNSSCGQRGRGLPSVTERLFSVPFSEVSGVVSKLSKLLG